MISTTSTQRYSFNAIREEAINLVQIGVVALNQPLRILFEYLPARQWDIIESELELHDYLLRDRVIDLVGEPDWDSD
ncbi:DUF4327 family protein [Pleurocapsales cyanobacterium LEGE 10410]|nr:DUF4327 family protein [Pleurocapsales cyanobacterium LEGE 10410]